MNFRYSVIVPVYKESGTVNRTIEHIQRIRGDEKVELVVVDAAESPTTLPEVRCPEAVKLTAPKGRGRQLNRGGFAAKGEILVFLHADTLLPENAFSLMAEALESGMLAGAFSLDIDSDRGALSLIAGAARLRTRLTGVPYGDQALFMFADTFRALGGFADIPLMEDVDIARRILRSGGRIGVLPQRVRTSPRRWEEEGAAYCTLRNTILVTLYFLGVSPEALVKFYRR